MPRIEYRAITVFCSLAILLSVLGCEAPLDLEGVKKEAQKPVKRFDQFLSAAKDRGTAIVVSSVGAILVSSDGGETWERKDLPGAPTLIEAAACPDGSFAALDARRKVWISTDEGNAWEAKDIDTQESVTTFTCGPENGLWVGGSFTTILESHDKGQSWETTSFGTDAMFTDMQFVNRQFGIAVGEFGTVAFTENGGDTWEIGPSISNDFYPQAALFSDRENGYVVGLSGKILTTSDGGATWVYEDTPTEAPLYGISRQGPDLYAVGEGGEMLRRADDGWKRVEHGKPARSYLRAALPLSNQQLLIAGGAGGLFRVSTQN